LMIAAVLATRPVLHPSIRGGAMGMLFILYSIPALCLALVAWAVVTRNLAAGTRRVTLVAAILAACGAHALLRTDGMFGQGRSQLAGAWPKPPKEKSLPQAGNEPPAPPAPAAAPATKKTAEERPASQLSVAPPARPSSEPPATVAAARGKSSRATPA